MNRIPFSQVLKNAEIDYRREYDRLYAMFYVHTVSYGNGINTTLHDYCAANFMSFPHRGTCIGLEDFDYFYGFHFEKVPSTFDVDYLISFCEYSYNLLQYYYNNTGNFFTMYLKQAMELFIQQISKVIETIGYMANVQDGLTNYVPKNQAVISVSEIIGSDLSYKVIEYNHHSMKGDIKRKRDIIWALANLLEPQQTKLKEINATMEKDLFFLFNNLNIRHNNAEPNCDNYKPFIASMSNETLEQWYDDTYQTCLLAFLELDHLERKKRIAQLKQDIQS